MLGLARMTAWGGVGTCRLGARRNPLMRFIPVRHGPHGLNFPKKTWEDELRDKISAKLERLEEELEWSRDLQDVGLRDTQNSLSDLRADLARFKTELAGYQAHQDKLALRLETMAQGLGRVVDGLTRLEKRASAPRKIIRDQDGLISKVEVDE